MKHFLLKRKKLLIILLIVVVALVAILWPKPPKELDTQTVKEKDIAQTLTATGTITSVQSVDLNFLAGGKLVYLNARKGEYVQAGQTLAVLDQRTTQKNLETSLKDYALQRNAFEQTRDDQNDHSPADALNDKMKRILEDNQNNLDKAIISVQLQELAREQSILTTPIAGIVTKADAISTGINVTAATTFSVADPDNLIFKIEVDEADIGKIREGQPATVILEAYPEDELELNIGAIDFASHTSDTGGTVFTVESAIPQNIDKRFRIGMNGDAEILLARVSHALTVPLGSLTDDNAVYVKTEDGFVKKKVRTGIQSDTEIEVLSGIEKDDKVALQPDEAEKHVKEKKKKTFFFF